MFTFLVFYAQNFVLQFDYSMSMIIIRDPRGARCRPKSARYDHNYHHPEQSQQCLSLNAFVTDIYLLSGMEAVY